MTWSPLTRALVSLWLVFQLSLTGLTCLPPHVLGLRDAWTPQLRQLASVVGLRQYWGLFAPSPPTSNSEVLAEVDLADGTHVVWHADPQNGPWSLRNNVRYRKWKDWLWWHRTSRAALEDTVAFLRSQFEDPRNPAQHIHVQIVWWLVPPPVAGDYQPLPLPPPEVDQADLYDWTRPAR